MGHVLIIVHSRPGSKVFTGSWNRFQMFWESLYNPHILLQAFDEIELIEYICKHTAHISKVRLKKTSKIADTEGLANKTLYPAKMNAYPVEVSPTLHS